MHNMGSLRIALLTVTIEVYINYIVECKAIVAVVRSLLSLSPSVPPSLAPLSLSPSLSCRDLFSLSAPPSSLFTLTPVVSLVLYVFTFSLFPILSCLLLLSLLLSSSHHAFSLLSCFLSLSVLVLSFLYSCLPPLSCHLTFTVHLLSSLGPVFILCCISLLSSAFLPALSYLLSLFSLLSLYRP